MQNAEAAKCAGAACRRDQGGGEALRGPEVVVVILSRREGGSHCVPDADTTSDKPAFRRFHGALYALYGVGKVTFQCGSEM